MDCQEVVRKLGVQRYISKELTHFVGKGKRQEEQYSILLDILKSGVLKTFLEQNEKYVVLECKELVSSQMPHGPVEDMYQPQVVCFCDIPVEDLEIHMRKYGRFGLSFLKPFLIEYGANPVLYVANNSGSLDVAPGEALKDQYGDDPVPRKALFQESIRAYHDVFETLLRGDLIPSGSDEWSKLYMLTCSSITTSSASSSTLMTPSLTRTKKTSTWSGNGACWATSPSILRTCIECSCRALTPSAFVRICPNTWVK